MFTLFTFWVAAILSPFVSLCGFVNHYHQSVKAHKVQEIWHWRRYKVTEKGMKTLINVSRVKWQSTIELNKLEQSRVALNSISPLQYSHSVFRVTFFPLDKQRLHLSLCNRHSMLKACVLFLYRLVVTFQLWWQIEMSRHEKFMTASAVSGS